MATKALNWGSWSDLVMILDLYNDQILSEQQFVGPAGGFHSQKLPRSLNYK